ncbi:MAG: UDP-N-acetylglucosamine 1-carboxyvinyltransferase [Anaerolineaceae bacterium]|nr:UDP-N-acetylglucosamine 1-carboxyvinyltransferase [Anaerolineaceae bacterium]
MDMMVIRGGKALHGTVRAGGSKNAALPMMAAALLAEGRMKLRNVPDLMDIRTMSRLLRSLGVEVVRKGHTLELEVTDHKPVEAVYEIMRTMRAGICVMGPLLARRREARVSLPGGCNIGSRPVDLHTKGMIALGARVRVEHGYLLCSAPRGLKGRELYLGGPFGSTVLGTANVMMAASLARGATIVEAAACEPEVQNLARLLVAMGARISGIGTPRLQISGVARLEAVTFEVIPDRIEAGTLLMAGAATGGRVTVENARWDHLMAPLHKLEEMGVKVRRSPGGAISVVGRKRFKPVDVTTLSFPAYPTDLQAQLMALLCRSDGISVVTEKVFPDRFMHVAELNRMGADIRKENNMAIVHGVRKLSGAPVMASDLRASAALVLAGLVAEGETEVRRIYHLDRGYEKLDRKLRTLGADIRRKKQPEGELPKD